MKYEDFKNLDSGKKDLALIGFCPFCEEKVKGWKPMFGAFAPEWWASIRESGIDPANGHKKDCIHKDIDL